jgi:hypothetical protein
MPNFPSPSRRDFLRAGAAAVTAASLGAPPLAARDAAADELIRELVRTNNAHIPGLLAKQEKRPGHRWLGGIVNEYGLHTVQGASGFIAGLTCAVCAPESKYRHSAELVEPLQLAVRYLRAAQYDDGTVDLYSTNFRSPPDTAFVLENICPACALLRATGVPAFEAVAAELGRFIVRGADGLVAGGIHTPNHRWVVCAALAWAHALFPDLRYVARVEQWLAETIDLDPDGQYTEKSTTVYSPIVDRALITVARLLGRTDLYAPVRKNLEMTLYYVHPDGEVVTEASRRQDRYQRGTLARYYYSYRALALLDGNGRFAAMTRQIERTARSQISDLLAFLHEPGLARALPPDAPLPTDYARVFPHSSLARVRRNGLSATILAGNTTLFSLRRGPAALEAVRLASAFFGKGQFAGDALEVQGGRYVLRQALDGPYFQPLSKGQIAGGEHVKMAPNGTLAPNSKALRARSNVQNLETIVTVSETAGKFRIEFAVTGTAEVPVAIELAFRHGGKLHGVEPVPGVADAFLLRGDTGRYEFGSETIEFGPGRVEHTYTQVRGALPKWDGQCVYLTGLTPFWATLTIG